MPVLNTVFTSAVVSRGSTRQLWPADAGDELLGRSHIVMGRNEPSTRLAVVRCR